MNIGVVVPVAVGDGDEPGVPSWPTIRAFAQRAEELGLDSIWVPDHLLPYVDAIGGPGDIHEAWTLLAALAASTTRIGLGTLVTATPFRSPALLAKMAVGVDLVSGGRLVLGLGTGYHEPEFAAFGYPPAADRPVSRFEEALRIIVPLLRGESVTFEGRFHEVRDAALLPRPERRIPVLIAARGPRMLRLTARWADAWNTAWFSAPDERFEARMEQFGTALAAEGRDRSSVTITVGMRVATEPVEQVAAALAGFARHRVDHVIVRIEPPRNERALARLTTAIETYRGADSPAAAVPVSQ